MIRPIANEIGCFMKRKYGLSPMERISRRRVVVGECWETSLSPSKVYPQLKVSGENLAIHRIVFETHNGPLAEGMYVLHHCDNPRCHRPEHLYAGTLSENMRDMWARGRHKKPTPRINRVAVLALADIFSQKEIAARVGCTQTAVSAILRAAGKSRGRDTSFNKATKKKATNPK